MFVLTVQPLGNGGLFILFLAFAPVLNAVSGLTNAGLWIGTLACGSLGCDVAPFEFCFLVGPVSPPVEPKTPFVATEFVLFVLLRLVAFVTRIGPVGPPAPTFVATEFVLLRLVAAPIPQELSSSQGTSL